MAPLRLFVSSFLSLPAVGLTMQTLGAHIDRRDEGRALKAGVKMRTLAWVESLSVPVGVESIKNPENQTAIVTYAGKKNMEYIDGAIMLAMSIRKHLPDYPMVALVIKGMAKKSQKLLRNAGWHLAEVPNWDGEYCGEGCNLEFLGRWHDSFEKINTFRLPFERVLFLDSDTYIFSSRIQDLLKKTELPDGHIAMARDGCKDDFNSGVMLYRPDLSLFAKMLRLVIQRQREQILDQSLVNEIYRGKIKEIPREFNCVDTWGTQPGQREACKQHCSTDVVVAHFTGHPKPTTTKRGQLELVRRPGSPALACADTNFGSCAKWSEYYCDIREHSKNLSKDIQYSLKSTGSCCHSPFDPERDTESCKECPATLDVRDDQYADTRYPQWVLGTYVKTSMRSTKFNGGRPIYIKGPPINSSLQSVYLYFVQRQVLWMIGPDASSNAGIGAYANREAQCPRDASKWSFWNGTDYVRRRLSLKALPNGPGAPPGTEHIAWNLAERRWDRERMPEGF